VGDELKPTFNFSKVSRQWSKSFATSVQNATRAQITLQRPAPVGDSTALQAHLDAQEKALDVIAQISDEQAGLIAQVLTDVPPEWLIDGAPEAIDWSKIESFDWIQEEYYGEILNLIQSGEARTLAKK